MSGPFPPSFPPLPGVPLPPPGPLGAPPPPGPSGYPVTQPKLDPRDPARHRLATDTDDGMLLVISGPSGVGKTTITRAVERSLSGSVFSVSATTRPRTEKDIEGVDYHFVDDATFDRMIADGEFLEWVDLFGKRYGTPRKWVLEQLARGRLVILEIDVIGAIKVKSQIPESFGIFIHPPNEETLLRRLRERKREDEASVQRRFAEAQREIAQSSAIVETHRGSMPVYDRHIVNDNLDHAISEALRLVSEERFLRAARRRDPE